MPGRSTTSSGGGGESAQKGPKRGKTGKSAGRGGGSNLAEAEKWKRLALTRKETLTIEIPKRQFMGPSAELDARLTDYVEKEILRIINQ